MRTQIIAGFFFTKFVRSNLFHATATGPAIQGSVRFDAFPNLRYDSRLN